MEVLAPNEPKTLHSNFLTSLKLAKFSEQQIKLAENTKRERERISTWKDQRVIEGSSDIFQD